MTKSNKYSPHQASEKLVTPYTLCRASADWAGTGAATLGESAQAPNGRFMSKMGRRADLLRAKKAGGWDRTGYGQRHVPQMHAAMFPDLPQPTIVVTRDFSDDLWRHLGQKPDGPKRGDYAISVALDLSVLSPSSPLRRYTGPVNHQVCLWVRNASNDKVYVLDGMAPYSQGDKGYWAPRSDIVKAAKAIEEGLVLCELYPVGGWTAERLKTKELRQDFARVKAVNADLRARVQSVQDECEVTVTDLQKDLAACEAQETSSREEILDEGIQALEALK